MASSHGTYQDLHGFLSWDSEAELSKSAVLFLKRWVGFRETSKGWCRTCAQLPRIVWAQAGRGKRTEPASPGEKVLAVLQYCLVGGVAFSRKTHQSVAEGTREKPGERKKMSIMTSPADLLARPLIGCIQQSQRAKESIEEDHTHQSPGSTELRREDRGVHLEGQITAIQHKKYISFGLDIGNFPNASLYSS